MSQQEIKQRILQFLSQHIRTATLGDDDPIFQSKAINSLLAMQLVLFVEKQFAITIENEDLDPENFQSINTIAAFVARKNGAF